MTEQVHDYYILFPNHQEGLLLHRELRAAGVACAIAPTPREASSFCGMSIRVLEADRASAEQVIAASQAKVSGIASIPRRVTIWSKTC